MSSFCSLLDFAKEKEDCPILSLHGDLKTLEEKTGLPREPYEELEMILIWWCYKSVYVGKKKNQLCILCF